VKNPLFYAKILLFGEYGIIENSRGLTLPYSFYKGSLKFKDKDTKTAKNSNYSLLQFYYYLVKLEIPEKFKLNLLQLKQDIDAGMYFDSDIPQGYGIGSSGALVAAIFDQYAINKFSPESIKKNEISLLKEFFGKMESCFHGKSSGIDPLICYMNIPLLIQSKDSIDKIGFPVENLNGKGAIFLINSEEVGETGPMVQIFFEKLKNKGFRKTLKEEFIKYNDACIESFINKDFSPFFENLKDLSTWAFIHFKPMIPKRFLKVWEYGIQSNAYYLKLCGSGGGGYILGFTADYSLAENILKDYKKEVIYRF